MCQPEITGTLQRFRKRGIWFTLPNGLILSVIWGYGANCDTKFEGGDFNDLLPSPEPEHEATLGDLLRIVREEAGNSVEIAGHVGHEAPRNRYEGWVHPEDWDDDILGWQDADAVRAFALWLISQPDSHRRARRAGRRYNQYT